MAAATDPGRALWEAENVELLTVGVDVGSTTSHLMLSRVRLQRAGGALSSRFVVVGRDCLHRSPVRLTPYRPGGAIDAARLAGFVADAYRAAGVDRSDVDSGAVVLTGLALERRNARAIAEALAVDAGGFVCAAAGHHLEALLAAHGSGAVALSETRPGAVVLHADVGGGTTKLARLRDGEALDSAALAVGGRLLVRDSSGAVARLDGPAVRAAAAAGVDLAVGAGLSPADESRLARVLVAALVAAVRGEPPPAGLDLHVTGPLPAGPAPDLLTLSGGVAEYVLGRERADFGDLGPALAAELRRALDDGRIPLPLADPGEGIRATVIGASQFTVQVSGDTIAVSDEGALPLRNVPVLAPRVDLAGEFTAAEVAAAIGEARRLLDGAGADGPVALAFRWQGDARYRRLRSLAEGVRLASGPGPPPGPGSPRQPAPLVVLIDGDVAKALGGVLERDLGFPRPLVCLDGLRLRAFDYVDVGRVLRPACVVPVVIKSLLFSGPERAQGAA